MAKVDPLFTSRISAVVYRDVASYQTSIAIWGEDEDGDPEIFLTKDDGIELMEWLSRATM